MSDVHWPSVRLGCGVAAAGTAALGIPLLLWSGSMWWFAAAGIASLFAGSAAAGRRAEVPDPLLNGAVVGGLYFAGFLAVVFGGEVASLLPDPLPGLPRGDSTFFFTWPLAQVGASTLGSAVGGRVARR